MDKKHYFLTVDWCNTGKRGLFTDKHGKGYWKTQPHTPKEMYDILGPFWLILRPASESVTEEVLVEYTHWYPLAEYNGEFGIVRKT